jgi:hypothetical protein
MHNRRFWGVIRSLLLGQVDKNRTNRRREDDISKPLSLKDPRRSLRGVECPVQIDFHEITPLVGRAVFSGAMVRHAGIHNHDIELAEVARNLLEGYFDFVFVGDIAFVRSCLDVVSSCDFCS